MSPPKTPWNLDGLGDIDGACQNQLCGFGRNNWSKTLSPSGSLAEWKAKLPLSLVAEGKIDGRTITGLKKCVTRLSARKDNKEKVTEALKLNGYLSQVEEAEKLAGEKFNMQPLSKIYEVLDMFHTDGVPIPAKVKLELTKKVLQQLVAEKYADMLETLNPFLPEIATFDYKAPKVQALAETSQEKVKLFQKYMFTDLLSPLIVEGERCKDEVQGLCATAMDLFSDVDLSDLDQTTAIAYDESTSIFKAFLAILDPKFETHREDEVI
eukprot:5756959-Amphidinium_carterae.5